MILKFLKVSWIVQNVVQHANITKMVMTVKNVNGVNVNG